MTSDLDTDRVLGGQFIFVAGAPGSGWSSVARALSYAMGVQHSDESDERTYTGPDGDETVAPGHFGASSAPVWSSVAGSTTFAARSRAELTAELCRPFRTTSGTMILKSHFFCRQLDVLSSWFPRARFVLVHRSDDACYDWWLRCGGPAIPLPRYDAYGGAERVRRAIAADNAALVSFADDQGHDLVSSHELSELCSALGLAYSPRAADLRSQQAHEATWLSRLPGSTLEEKLSGILAGTTVAAFPASGRTSA